MTFDENNNVEFAASTKIEDGFSDLESAHAEIGKLRAEIADLNNRAQERNDVINRMVQDKAHADTLTRDRIAKLEAIALPMEKVIEAYLAENIDDMIDDRIDQRVRAEIEQHLADEMSSELSYGSAGDVVKELAREVLADELGEALDNADLDGLTETIASEIKSALESASIRIDF